MAASTLIILFPKNVKISTKISKKRNYVKENFKISKEKNHYEGKLNNLKGKKLYEGKFKNLLELLWDILKFLTWNFEKTFFKI
jgi:hypothetical protein